MTNVLDLNNAESHEPWMALALEQAQCAGDLNEVPVGAVIVHEGKIVGGGFNRKEMDCQALHHAEIVAIRQASETLGRWRLSGCTMYVTLEPCLMCAGAIVSARLDQVVYGAKDPKAGAAESIYEVLSDPRLNHQPRVVSGVLAVQSASLLQAFFKKMRQEKAFSVEPKKQPDENSESK